MTGPLAALARPAEPDVGRRSSPALVALLLVQAAWGAWLIWRSSFPVAGRRWFCLFDDAMISMAYARNLVEGYGLSWARWGPPVEGFTHPLWLALMVPVNLLPLALPLRSLVVQLLSLALLLALVVAVQALVRAHFDEGARGAWVVAAVPAAFYYPLAQWSLLGMETAAQALLLVVAVHLALTATDAARPPHLQLWLVCAAAWLLRMDMLPLVVLVQAWVVLHGAVRRGSRRWLVGLGVFAAVAAGYELFRWLYFHDVLPNTYYLKLTGVPATVRLLRGLDGLQSFVRPQLPLLLAVAVGVVALLPRRPKLLLPAAVVAAYAAYAVAIGGDAWGQQAEGPLTNRFLTVGMPLVFVLLAALVAEVLAAWRAAAAGPSPACRRAAVLAVAALALLSADGLWRGPTAEVAWRRVLGIERPAETERNRRVVERLQRLQELAAPGATVATVWAGIPAYFTDYRMVDMLGYNDRRIARLPSRFVAGEDDWGRYRPGHDKLDLEGILERTHPDVVFQLWGQRQLGVEPEALLRRSGYRPHGVFWVRQGSPWVRGAAAGR